jgi:hypothetical protein
MHGTTTYTLCGCRLLEEEHNDLLIMLAENSPEEEGEGDGEEVAEE